MDKILAFSILSSSPADIAAGGFSTRLSWRTSSGGSQKPPPPPPQQQAEKKATKQQDKAAEQQASRPEARPRFAPEFDGINCFESIVSL